ncbi:hypothetical protein PFISCL1PPCAC_3049, partial [Pristionchus fissidentatus]
QKRSVQSTRMIRKSLVILLIQLAVHFLLLIIPAAVIYSGLVFHGLITFETSLKAYMCLHLHPIGHNLILLSITSPYRKFIVAFV